MDAEVSEDGQPLVCPQVPLASEEHFRNPAVTRDLSGQTVHRAAVAAARSMTLG